MRTLTATNTTAATAAAVRAVWLTELDFSGGIVRATNGAKSLDFESNTYTTVGDLGSISAITEDTGLSSPGVSLTLSGIDAALIAATIDEEYHQRSARILLGFVDAAGDLLDDPVEVWSGRMDAMSVTIDEGLASISLVCESRLTMKVPRRSIRNAETQRTRHSGDSFYDFLHQLEGLTLKWGVRTVRSPTVVEPGTDQNRYVP